MHKIIVRQSMVAAFDRAIFAGLTPQYFSWLVLVDKARQAEKIPSIFD